MVAPGWSLERQKDFIKDGRAASDAVKE